VTQDERVAVEERAALEELYRRMGGKLWRALTAYSGDPELAEDAAAEAFTQALGRGAEIRDPEAWIWRAAFKIAAGELKRRSNRGVAETDLVYEMPESVKDVLGALKDLPPRQRAVVVFHDYADRPADEIARILGVTRATVYVHLSEGRRRLRRMLEDHDA
jgi:RNA polymerase sigma-70 factor, ECF subfamily